MKKFNSIMSTFKKASDDLAVLITKNNAEAKRNTDKLKKLERKTESKNLSLNLETKASKNAQEILANLLGTTKPKGK